MPEQHDDIDESSASSAGPAITPELFLFWRSPRFGSANPEPMSNPVWEWLARSKLSAYQANERMGVPSPFRAGPGWCFERFGQSSTQLADGSRVFIAGEHEDFYDPDFYIYNDVVVERPSGCIDIFGYPREIFPPTDFHSATLVGERIITIGNLGYEEQRKAGVTPVHILDLRNFAISTVQTTGTPPGWIHQHEALLSNDGGSIIVRKGLLDRGKPGESFVENLDDWRLELANWKWQRLTERRWQRWEVMRKDGRRIHLWEIGQALWKKEHPEFAQSLDASRETQADSLKQELGCEPDLELFERLFRPNLAHEILPATDENEWRVHRINVAGVVVRYVENACGIQMTVEGDLPEFTLERLKQDLLEKMSMLENSPFHLVEL
ncbi:MAG TPA: hypothetical protein VN873_03000 [Candidatus Angelobacter sp.]|nr:hypothetical protein [Candidatus Angelobacter sp.]